MDAFFELNNASTSVSVVGEEYSSITLYVNDKVAHTSNGILLISEQAKALADAFYALAVRDY